MGGGLYLKGTKREKVWTEAVAASSVEFVEGIKAKLGVKARSSLGDRQLPLEELTLIREGGIRKESWPNSSDVYAVLNQDFGELYVMDGKIYNSMLVRMLLGDTAKFEEHFELVMDREPWVRVYRAK